MCLLRILLTLAALVLLADPARAEDCVLIQDGKAHEIWRNTRKVDLQTRYTSELVAAIVETPSGTVQVGHRWNGTTFSPPPPAPPADLDAEARAIPRHVRAMVLYQLRDKLQRTPTAAERRAAIEELVQAYKDVEP